MGCWNGTCGLSNLPVFAGDEIYIFPILKKERGYKSFCYTHSHYSVCLTPFLAKYDDYGRGEDCSGVALPFIMEGLRSSLIEMEVGENTTHDIEVKRDNFSIDLFFEAVHEGRLKTSSGTVYFTMVRKDVVDNLLDEYVAEFYHNAGSGYQRLKYTYHELWDLLPEYVEAAWQKFNAKPSEFRFFTRLFDDQNHFLTRLLGDDFIFGHSSCFNAYDFKEAFGDLYSKDSAQGIALVKTLLIGIMVDSVMMDIRKIWLPPQHQGSQSQALGVYQLMNKISNSVIANIQSEYEDYGDEEDES